MTRFLSAAATALALVAAGCGGGGGTAASGEDAALALDSAPGAVHAGIYVASARAYDEAEGIELEIEAPEATTPARALADGEVDLAVLPIDALGDARAQGDEIVGVMAIVQRVRDRPDAHYPELVLATERRTIDERPEIVRAAIRSIQRGYIEAFGDPESAVSAMLAEEPSLSRADLTEQLDAIGSAFFDGEEVYGRLVPRRLEAWAATREDPPSLEAAFDTTLVERAENP